MEEDKLEQIMNVSSFDIAQPFVNFVILHPSSLPIDYSIKNITLKKETIQSRSSLRFEIVSGNRVVRVKEFFYDWGLPVVYADTNLVSQGTAFVVNGIVGFIGKDYKGNQAACYARWFTNIELSVLKGIFDEEEIIQIVEALSPLDKDLIKQLGEKPFTVTSYTARYGKQKWQEDEISRVEWYESDFDFSRGNSMNNIYLPSLEFDAYFLDSIGYKEHEFGVETHLLFRSSINYTDGIWYWLSPKDMIDSINIIEGNDIGTRQSWSVKKEILQVEDEELTIFVGKQNTDYPGWFVIWEEGKYIYQVYVRPSINFNRDCLYRFIANIRKVV